MTNETDVSEASAGSGVPGTTGAVRKRLGLLLDRTFFLLWFGETTSAVGNSVAVATMPLIAVVTLQSSTFQVAALAAASWVPWLVVGLPAGVWVDQLPRRAVMVACNFVSVVAFASAPLAWWFGVLSYTWLVIAAVVAGTASVFFNTAYRVYLPEIIGKEHLIEANAKLQGSESAADIVGPTVAGVLAQWVGAVVGLLFNAVTFLVSTVCLLRSRRSAPRLRPAADRLPIRRQILVGLRFVASDPYLRPIVFYCALANLAIDGYEAIRVVFLVRTLDASPVVVGLALAAISIGGILGALAAQPISRRFGTGRGLFIWQLCAGPAALLVPLAAPGPGILLFIAGSLVMLVSVVSGNIILSSFRQTYCPADLQGKVVSTMLVINYSTIPVGALLGGALATVIGPRATLFCMAALFMLSGLTLVPGPMRRQRDLPKEPRVNVG
ncbi:MFS transporter [Amycolatopsis aidingensis]|uniref:MFS transporter n=1 Tax=Amycolatopsis aidingensis TaxID=2842453 RepID=UPI001C0E0C44|nr:MFS transporter [Amycolatopsis aidingensis]